MVAKITCDCDFNPQLIPLEKVKTFIDASGNTNNELDASGNLIWEYELDTSCNIIYEYEYEMKYVTLDGTIITKEDYELDPNDKYKIAFVGTTYKCS
jgi:hypothetical protein